MEDSQQKHEGKTSYTDAEATGEWNRCINDLKVHDEASVKAWKEEIDTLLVFAGLFSGVLTAFSVQSYTLLQPGPNSDATVQLLVQISAQLGSFNMSGGFINSTQPAATTIPTQAVSSSSVRINVLWFSSLICSLSAASIGILVKQWLNQYSTELASVSRRAARTRQYRNDCMRLWRVHNLVMSLPMLLQSSLGLFLAGLLELLWTLHPTVASVATMFVAILGLFQLATTVLPAFVQGCPYQSPQSWAFVIFIQLCKIPYNYGAGYKLRMYTWRDREQAIIEEMDDYLDLRMLATADFTFMDDNFLDHVIRPCSSSIDWSSQTNKVQWFRDVVDYRTSRFGLKGHADAVANLALDTVLKPRKSPRGESHIDGLLFSCLNNATPEWWQAHSPHSQTLLEMAAAQYRKSKLYNADAFGVISKIRAYGAKDVLVQMNDVEVIIEHIWLCHENGDMDDFLAAMDVFMHYAANPIHISDLDFAQLEAELVQVLQLLQNFYRSRIKIWEVKPALLRQETNSTSHRRDTNPTQSIGQLLELILSILRVTRRNQKVVQQDFLEMLIGFLWDGDSVSKRLRTRGLQKLTSWDQQRCEVFLAELDATRTSLLLSSELPDPESPQLARQVSPLSETTIFSHKQQHPLWVSPSLPDLSALCTRMPSRVLMHRAGSL